MDLTLFDAKILISVLFWSNLTSMVLVYIYLATSVPLASEKKLTRYVLLAKACFTLAFLLVKLRNYLPDIIDTNGSHTLVLLGVMAEAYALLTLIHKNIRRNVRLILIVGFTGIVLLNLARIVWHDNNLFTAVGPFAIFAILIVPACKLIFSRRSTTFKRYVGAFYVLFTLLLLPRGICVLLVAGSMDHPHPLIQSLGYTSMVLLVVFSLSAFLLLMKEDTDIQMQMLAQTDSLTGLNNRQHFFSLVLPAFDRHKREKILCSVIFMDIDHFKRVNDTYGHAFGDDVIAAVANTIKTSVRGYDICCRYGGEEFAAFIDSADPDSGATTAERIRSSIEELTFSKHPEFKCTISLGVATSIPGDKEKLDNVIACADAALYEAKKSGRNRVVERSLPERSNSKRITNLFKKA